MTAYDDLFVVQNLKLKWQSNLALSLPAIKRSITISCEENTGNPYHFINPGR